MTELCIPGTTVLATQFLVRKWEPFWKKWAGLTLGLEDPSDVFGATSLIRYLIAQGWDVERFQTLLRSESFPLYVKWCEEIASIPDPLIARAREILSRNQVDLVLYHNHCRDGLGAFFCAHHFTTTRLGRPVEGIPQDYQQTPPNVQGRHVLVVDFSYKRSVLEEMKIQAASLLVLDHHKSAQGDLEGLPYACFDMNRSGAMLAWQYFFDLPPPPLIQYIQDRDLWRLKMSESKAFSAGLDELPMTIDTLALHLESPEAVNETIRTGKVALRMQDRRVEQMAKKAYYKMWRNYHVAVINANLDISELGNALASHCDFAVLWRTNYQNCSFDVSLRSNNKVDLSVLAQRYGGGGHPNAAGLSLKFGLGIDPTPEMLEVNDLLFR